MTVNRSLETKLGLPILNKFNVEKPIQSGGGSCVVMLSFASSLIFFKLRQRRNFRNSKIFQFAKSPNPAYIFQMNIFLSF